MPDGMLDYVLDYRAAVEAGAGSVGAKAHTLATLAQCGYPVPDGIVISCALDRHLRTALGPLLAAAAAMTLREIAAPPGRELLAAIRRGLEGGRWPDALVHSIADHLTRRGLHDTPLAVRSSAVGEDGTERSFSGVHRGILDVRGLDGVVQAIGRCLASLWTPEAIAYRRRFEIADADVRCGVLICRLVSGREGAAPPASGVAFSADPRDGAWDVVTLEAVAGYGEALLQGGAPGGSATYRRRLRRWHATPGWPAILTRSRMTELLSLIERLHWSRGAGERPQDVEWVFDGHRFWIVQCRPVTALPAKRFAYLCDKPEIWSDANAREVYPNDTSPFSWSVFGEGAGWALLDAHRVAGFTVPEGVRIVRRRGGKVYLNVSALHWATFDAFGIEPAEFDRDVGGEHPVLDLSRDTRSWRRQAMRTRRALRLALRVVRSGRRAEREFAAVHAAALGVARADLGSLDRDALQALWHGTLGMMPTRNYMLASASGPIWMSFARRTLAPWLSPTEIEGCLSGLMASSGGVTSAEQAYALQQLAAEVAHNESLAAASATPQWAAFLHEYGHRGFQEMDLARPRWREQPEEIWRMVEQLRGAAHDRQSAHDRKQAAQLGMRALPPPIRALAGLLVRQASRGFARREAAKSASVAALGTFRCIALEVGRRLVDAGKLDDVVDIFGLTAFDVCAWLDGTWSGDGARAILESHAAGEWAAKPADWANPPWFGENDSVVATPAMVVRHQKTWAGLAVSPGHATGPAAIVHNIAEARGLRAGDVLIAPETDPGWTPYFLLASAIVVERGGFMSHTATVARELAIPAVFNVTGATSQIPARADVTVDGFLGTIRLPP